MESEVINAVLNSKSFAEQGIFFLLFVCLLFYVLKDGRQRENKNQEVIKENQTIILSLTEKLCIIDDIKTDVDEIKQEILKKV